MFSPYFAKQVGCNFGKSS